MNVITKATLVAVLVALGLALGAWAAEPPKVGETPQEQVKITHDWPGYGGPDGQRADRSQVPLLDDLSQARLVWVSEHDDLGYGKTTSGGGHAYGADFWKPSGMASPILSAGTAMIGYFDAKDPVLADDVVLGLDAATGKTRWKQVFAGKGMNRGAGKHVLYGPTPVANAGKVYHLGSAGRVYCLEIATGKVVWESEIPSVRQALEAEAAKAVQAGANKGQLTGKSGVGSLRMISPLAIADGVVLAQVANSVHGIDGATGKYLWGQPAATAIPVAARVKDAEFALLAGAGNFRLVRPKTGEVLWTVTTGANYHEPLVADGLAFVAAARTKSAGRNAALAAYALNEQGAELVWKNEEFPLNGEAWLAYRDGVLVAGGSSEDKDAQRYVMTFQAKDGVLLHNFRDPTLDRGRMHVWGDRIVVIGDHHHESLGAPCTYQSLSPGWKDLKKTGKPLTPRFAPNLRGVCGYEIMMRDAFADGFQFTRAIDIQKKKGVILCWDLRAGAPAR